MAFITFSNLHLSLSRSFNILWIDIYADFWIRMNQGNKHPINNTAPVQCARSIFISATAPRIWAVLVDIPNWPAWQSDILSSKLEGGLNPGSTFRWKSGGATIVSTLHTVDEPKAFGWTGKTFGIVAIHNWKIVEKDTGTLVQAEESMEGLLAVLFKKSFNRNLEKGMEHWLELLKKECEK